MEIQNHTVSPTSLNHRPKAVGVSLGVRA
jgi:hypothetical protein